MRKPVTALIASSVLLAGVVAAAPAAAAPAPSGCGFSIDLNSSKTTARVFNVSCSGTAEVRALINFRPSTGTNIMTNAGNFVSSGTSTATRPELGFTYVSHSPDVRSN